MVTAVLGHWGQGSLCLAHAVHSGQRRVFLVQPPSKPVLHPGAHAAWTSLELVCVLVCVCVCVYSLLSPQTTTSQKAQRTAVSNIPPSLSTGAPTGPQLFPSHTHGPFLTPRAEALWLPAWF